MDLIILNDGLYQLIPVTKQMLEGVELLDKADCFDLCEILRLKLSGYVDTLNLHIMKDGSALIGCMCRYSLECLFLHDSTDLLMIFYFL
jgi:hypothetical protein